MLKNSIELSSNTTSYLFDKTVKILSQVDKYFSLKFSDNEIPDDCHEIENTV